MNSTTMFLNRCLANSKLYTIESYDFENCVFWGNVNDRFRSVIYGKTLNELKRKAEQVYENQGVLNW